MATVSIVATLSGIAGVQSGIAGVEKGLASLEKRAASLSGALSRSGDSLSRFGTKATLGLTIPLGAALGGILKLGAAAEETRNLFVVSMGSMVKAADEFTKGLSENFGVNIYQAQQFVATIQAMTRGMGFSEAAAFNLSKGLTMLSYDMQSLYNIDPEDAFRRLQSGISGEIEPLKRLGIIVSENRVEQELLALGVKKTADGFTEQQKVLGRYIAIISQTELASGDLARTMSSATNQGRLIKSQFTEITATVGQALLPVLSQLLSIIKSQIIPVIKDGATWFSGLSEQSKGLAVALLGVLIVAGPLTKVLGLLLRGFALLIPVVAALPGILLSIPAAVAAAVAALALIVSNGRLYAEAFVASWHAVGAEMVSAIEGAGASVMGILADLVQSSLSVLPGIGEATAKAITDPLRAMSEAGLATADDYSKKASDSWQRAGDAMRAAGRGMISDITSVGEGLVEASGVDSLIAKFEEMFTKVGAGSKVTSEDIKRMLAESRAEAEALVRQLGDEAALHTKKTTKQIEQEENERRKLTRETLEYMVSVGKLSLEQYRELVRAEVSEEEEGTREKLELKKTLAEVNEKIAQREIELLKATGKITEEEMRRRIETLKEQFRALGEEGGAAVKVLSKEIEDLDKKSEASIKKLEFSFQGFAETVFNVFNRTKGTLATFFGDVVKGGQKTSDLLKTFFRSVTDSIIEEFARLAADSVFQLLFGTNASANAKVQPGSGGILGGVFGGGGGGGGIFGGGGSGGGGIIDMISGAGISAAVNSILPGSGFLTSALGIDLGGIGSSLLGGIGDIFGGFFESGGSRVLSGPELLVGGERGPERVTFEPLTGRRESSGGGMTLVIQGDLIADEIGLSRLASRVAGAVSRESGRKF